MFVDRATIHLKAGDGGNGCDSFLRTKMNRRGSPNGGPGGNGGNVVLISDQNSQTLLDFRYNRHFKARSGSHGSSNNKKGRDGVDCIIRVPPGTVIFDAHTGKVLRDLSGNNQSVIIARGGKGGSANSRNGPAAKGEKVSEREVVLELKLIAEAGIVGYPNAGKSTLISALSNTRPKIASYPFTTKAPMLGVVCGEARDFVVADIPGLIKGAHLGKGLGHQFLRHVERTKILIHLIDIAGVDGRDPVEDYHALNEELALYSKRLLKKRQVIVLNKTDLPDTDEKLRHFTSKVKEKAYPVSALKKKGLGELVKAIEEALAGEK